VAKIEMARLSRDYFRAFNQGIEALRSMVKPSSAYLGALYRPDFAAELADLLIRLNGIEAALCLGIHGGYLHFSLRTQPPGWMPAS
jgi:hypothetical protein